MGGVLHCQTTREVLTIDKLIRLATPEDVSYLGPRLRSADLKELKAAGYKTGKGALNHGFDISACCYTGINPETGQPAVMFGVVKTAEERGFNTIWLLGTDDVARHGRVFARRCRFWIRRFAEIYGIIGNAVDLDNVFYVRWLKWCGFRQISTMRHEGAVFGLFILEDTGGGKS